MNINFNPVSKNDELMGVYPKPARFYTPPWFKDAPAFKDNELKVLENGMANTTVKMCMPFNDALSSGYIQETWADIYIEITKEGTLSYKWSSGPQILKIRQENYGAYPKMEDMYPIEFTWHIPWMPELPKGYSALLTHPLNRVDLPFHTLSGVIDSDSYKYGVEKNQMPFYIKYGFKGIIPAGTPMYQIIPIKRDDWEAETCPYNQDLQYKENSKVRSKFWGGYKNYFWNKKNYK
jgi:hypothetical protein